MTEVTKCCCCGGALTTVTTDDARKGQRLAELGLPYGLPGTTLLTVKRCIACGLLLLFHKPAS